MANLIKVEVASSESLIYSGDVEYLVAPAYDGEIGIYPRHTPLIAKLKPGVLRLKLADKAENLILAISGGFIEVQPDVVTILSDVVVRTAELDEQKLVEQKLQAQELINRKGLESSKDVEKAYATLEMAIAQLKALDYIKKQKH